MDEEYFIIPYPKTFSYHQVTNIVSEYEKSVDWRQRGTCLNERASYIISEISVYFLKVWCKA